MITDLRIWRALLSVTSVLLLHVTQALALRVDVVSQWRLRSLPAVLLVPPAHAEGTPPRAAKVWLAGAGPDLGPGPQSDRWAG